MGDKPFYLSNYGLVNSDFEASVSDVSLFEAF